MQAVRLSREKIVRHGGLALVMMLAGVSPAAALEYACKGTEPFWSLTIGGPEPEFSDPETGPDKLAVVEPRPAAGTSDDYAVVFETHSTARRSRLYTAVLHKDDENNCSDGMSDTEYPYTAVLIMPGQVLHGCCSAK